MSKSKQKSYADNKRKTRFRQFNVGDSVLVRQPQLNKLTPPYDPQPFIIHKVNGSMITAKRHDKTIVRNSSFFKPLNPTFNEEEEREEEYEASIHYPRYSPTNVAEPQRLNSPHSHRQTPKSLTNVAEPQRLSSPHSPRANHPHNKQTVTKCGRVVKMPKKYTE